MHLRPVGLSGSSLPGSTRSQPLCSKGRRNSEIRGRIQLIKTNTSLFYRLYKNNQIHWGNQQLLFRCQYSVAIIRLATSQLPNKAFGCRKGAVPPPKVLYATERRPWAIIEAVAEIIARSGASRSSWRNGFRRRHRSLLAYTT